MNTEDPPAQAVLLEERRGGVAVLTLNRPRQRNGLDRELGAELLRALAAGSADPDVRCIAITGAGAAFCAGDDLGAVEELLRGDTTNAPAFPGTVDAYYLRICEAILTAPKPVIVGVNGACAGAGTEMACAADFRMASASARIGSCLVRVGHPGTAVLLPRVVGWARANDIYLTGRLLDAAEAERVGLVDRIVPDETFMDSFLAFADELAAGPTKAIGYYKAIREQAWGQPVLYGLRTQDHYHVRALSELEDGLAGPAAFLRREAPVFTGR